jgi:hypothetical protein
MEIAIPDDALIRKMDNLGELTKSGLLYEGNYQEWEDRLPTMLELIGFDDDKDDCQDKLKTGIPTTAFIKSLVVPRLLLIMPQPAPAPNNSWDQCLLPRLKFAAKPFRLMDLPVNVRIRIWRFVMDSQQGPISYTITADSPFGKDRIHPVTRVSREIRCETLALA